MMSDQVRKLSHELRLFGLHDACDRRSEEAVASALHPLDFLRLLLEDERLYRKNKFGERLVKYAKFSRRADLEDWDQTYDRGISKQKIKELIAGQFVHSKESLLFYGKTGEGKTHLAIALGKRLCEQGISVMFFSTNLLFEEVQAAKASGKYLAFLKRLNKTQIIIFDDFGLRNYTHEEATVLMDVLENRYQNGIAIVTSQVDAKGWMKLFEDPVIAEALIDRLSHPSQTIVLKGGSYREKLKSKNAKTN